MELDPGESRLKLFLRHRRFLEITTYQIDEVAEGDPLFGLAFGFVSKYGEGNIVMDKVSAVTLPQLQEGDPNRDSIFYCIYLRVLELSHT